MYSTSTTTTLGKESCYLRSYKKKKIKEIALAGKAIVIAFFCFWWLKLEERTGKKVKTIFNRESGNELVGDVETTVYPFNLLARVYGKLNCSASILTESQPRNISFVHKDKFVYIKYLALL